MTTVSAPWVIGTTPAVLAGWLRERLDGLRFHAGMETDAGGMFAFVDCRPKLDAAGNLIAIGYGQVHTFKAERPDTDFVTGLFEVFSIRAVALDATRVEPTITLLDARIAPLLDALRAAIEERWGQAAGVAAVAKEPAAAVAERVAAERIEEPYPWPHTVKGIPGPVPSLAGVPWTCPCVFCGDYYPAEAVLPDLPVCLHCARFERQTLGEAARQQRQRNITDVLPSNWDNLVLENLAFACLKCGRRYEPSGEKIPLGIEHWCLACVIQRERQRAEPLPESKPAAAEAAGQLTPVIWPHCTATCRKRCQFPADLHRHLFDWLSKNKLNSPARTDIAHRLLTSERNNLRRMGAHGITAETWPAFVEAVRAEVLQKVISLP
jgi:hypothetical protein